MRKIVGMDLKLIEKVYAGKATEEDFKKLGAVKERVQKYLDKLHATKESLEHSGEITYPTPILGGISNVHTDNSPNEITKPQEKN